jgi:pimeloyl-ACP methyl ester carboxylesterase
VTDRFVQTNNIRLHYVDHPGGDPTIILMPGISANAHAFDGLVQAGLSPRFRLLAVDLRGRGLSDKPARGYSMAEHAADILGLLDALGIKKAVLGGHSFGALLTYYISARDPERVSQLILIDAAASLHPKVRDLIKPALDRLKKVFPSWDAYLAAMKQAPQYDGWWDPAVESYYRADVKINSDGTVQAQSRAENIAEALDEVPGEPWHRHLAKIEQPAILLNALGPCGPAGSPPVLPYEQAQETVRALKNCRYVEIPGNHYTMLYATGARRMVEAITEFVGR